MGTETTKRLQQLAGLAVELRLASPEQAAQALRAFETGRVADPAEWLQANGIISASERALLEQRAGIGAPDTSVENSPATRRGRMGPPPSQHATRTLPLSAPEPQERQPDQETGADTLAVEQPGRYTVRHLHASGGQARILLAFDEHVGREVALKEVALDELGAQRRGATGGSLTSVEMQRLLREARVTGQLEHPNIVPVYDLGRRKDGALYYTMRFVRGVTLSQRLAACRTLRERLRLLRPFMDICSAIAYAHSRGVIHRDIKPANAMVGEFGETVLLDWGIAKVSGKQEIRGVDIANEARLLREEALAETMAGSALGTPGYMSPEQALGKLDEIDERSDVWGLGALLYQVLTGQPPHVGKTEASVLESATKGRVKPVRRVCPEAPPELAAVAEKALQRDKAERYQSAKQLADDIESYMTGGRVSAYRYSSWELARRFAVQHKRAVGVATAVFAVIVAALITVSFSLQSERTARQLMETAREQEHRERLIANFNLATAYADKSDQLKDDYKLVSAAGFAAQSLFHNPAHPRSPFYSSEFAAQNPPARLLRMRAASAIYQTSLHGLAEFDQGFTAEEVLTRPFFSPDGRYVAVGSWDNRVRIWDLQTRAERRMQRGHDGRVNAVAYSPDGRLLATASNDQRVFVWDTDSGERRFVLSGHTKPVRAVSFSPDGSLLASAGWDGIINLWNVANGRLHGSLQAPGGAELDEVVFAPDGRSLASGGADRTLRIWSLETMQPREIARFSSAIESLAYPPKGDQLAVACKNEKAIRIFAPADGTPVVTLEGHSNGVVSLAYSPDGATLLSGGWDKTVRLWSVASGKLLATMENHTDFVSGVAFSRSGDHFATAGYDRTLKIWRLHKQPGLPTLSGHGDQVYGLAFSPDGKRLASGSWDKTVRVWDLATRTTLFELSGHESRIDRVAFSPDGTRIASVSKDRTLRLWSAGDGKPLAVIRTGDAEPQGVAFSPDGKLVATGGTDRTVQLWEASSGKLIAELKGHEAPINDVAFSPDGTRLASAGMDKLVLIWDVASRSLRRGLSGHSDWAWDVEWSRDGSRLISSGKDGVAILWDPQTGTAERRFNGHEQWVNSALLFPDGKLLASGSDDKSARIWNAATGEQLLKISAGAEVVALAISPDGSTLAIGDGPVIALYPMDFSALDADPKLLLERAAAAGFQPNVNLTEAKSR